MTHDLSLAVENRYNIIALVFFIPYIIFEFPSNALVRQIGVRNHLAAICFLWGCVMVDCGFVTSWQQLAGLRVRLGIFEAGFFPACVYLLSTWYVRCK
jgi:MFS family permease